MFESAVQPPAESLDSLDAGRPQAANTEAMQVNKQGATQRRYGADDFRALAARLTAGRTAPKPRPAAAPSVALPDLLAAFRRPDSHDEPPTNQERSSPGDDEAALGTAPTTDAVASAVEPVDAAPSGQEPEAIEAQTDADGAQEWHRDAPEAEALAVDGASTAEADGESVASAVPGDAAELEGRDEHPASAETASPGDETGSTEPVLHAAEEQADPNAGGFSGLASAPEQVAAAGEANALDGDDHRQRLSANDAEVIERTDHLTVEPSVEDVGQVTIETGPAPSATTVDESADAVDADNQEARPDHEAPIANLASDTLPVSGAVTVAGQPRPAAVPALRDSFAPDRHSGDTARMLLDIMAMPSGAVQPQERALAGDTLLRLVSRMPIDSVIALCERLCIMEAPPPLLVRRLVQHANAEVAGPLLERCTAISDQDLMNLIGTADAVRLRLIARRRHLSPALTDALIELGDASVLLTVVRNPGAALSPEAFGVLAERAKSHHALQAPLATRADTPAPIAFELFWSLPPELRRYVLSRFLTESATLDRILKIAHTLDDGGGPEGHVPSRTAARTQIDELVTLMAEGETAEAAQRLASIAGICHANALRIISDPAGEPLTIAMKALGLSRTQFAALAETLNDAPAAPLRAHRRIGELKTLFDSLSFTKARVLLTYWDWAAEQSGPYSGESE